MKVPFLDLSGMHTELLARLDEVWHDVVDSTAFIGGAYAERFEQAWAEYCGVEHAVGVANGTDAIELALSALGVGRGDEVIVPANTFIATAEAVVACGADPVFVDVEPATLLVTADEIEPAITERTAAIVPVHLYGQPCQMDDINALAAARDLAVIEDAAQAHGATWRGRRVGALGTAATFSFYPGKNLGAFGDAGAVVTDDAELAARVRSLANHGRADGEHVVHDLLGRNSRLDGIQAGVLLTKLDLLNSWNDRRRAARDRFCDHFAGSEVVPVAEHADARSVWHLNVVQVPVRSRVMETLQGEGIDVRIHYPQPCHRHQSFGDQARLPVVEDAAERILSLPLYPTLAEDEVDRVAEAVLAAVARCGSSA